MSKPTYHLEIQVAGRLYKSVMCEDGDDCHIALGMHLSVSDFVENFDLLKLGIKNIIVDIDAVLFNTDGKDYESCSPIEKNISLLNELFIAGYNIYLIESRNTTECTYDTLTKLQLDNSGIMYTRRFESWCRFRLDTTIKSPLISFRRTKNI